MIQKNLILVFCLFFVLSSLGHSQETIQERVQSLVQHPHVPNHLLIKFKDDVTELQKRQLLGNVLGLHFTCEIGQATWVTRLRMDKSEVYHLDLSSRNLGMEKVLTALLSSSLVEYAEPNHIYKACKVPDDLDPNQWDKRKIYCPSAWNTRTDGSGVIVAVLDTGVDYAHEDLAASCWTNEAEVGGTAGVDDDGNGYIDDFYGARFNATTGAYVDGVPQDVEGHGTHCAGVIGAIGNNTTGIAGVCWLAKIMPVKVLDDTGEGTAASVWNGIDYARRSGAKILNISWGSFVANATLKLALDNARKAGIVVVCAAGNDYSGVTEGNNNDVKLFYPASYVLDNLVSVGACDPYDFKSTFSNYGNTKVHLFAPGEDIYSTLPGNTYDLREGTSMAAAQVSGAMALIWSEYPTMAYRSLILQVFNTVDKFDQLAKYCSTDGRLNLSAALTPPSAIAGFGVNKGGLQMYPYSDGLSPWREKLPLQGTKRRSPQTDKRLPKFTKTLVYEKPVEVENRDVPEEKTSDEGTLGDERSMGWIALNNVAAKAVALCDVNGDGYPEALYSTGSSVPVWSVPEKKLMATISPGVGTITKILPVEWKDADETTTVFNDVVITGSTGIAIWRERPTRKLTKIYSGNVLTAAYIHMTYTYPKAILFCVAGKGIFEYWLDDVGAGNVWHLHPLEATSLVPFKRDGVYIDVLAAFPGYGIYRYDAEYDDGTWHYEDAEVPSLFGTANVDGVVGDEIIAYFPYSGGLFARIGTEWSLITPDRPSFIERTDIYYDNKDEVLFGFETPMKNIVILEYYPEATPYWGTYGLAVKNFDALASWTKGFSNP